jgi:hypothetical protein
MGSLKEDACSAREAGAGLGRGSGYENGFPLASHRLSPFAPIRVEPPGQTELGWTSRAKPR